MIKILNLNDKRHWHCPKCSCVDISLNKFYLLGEAKARVKINREGEAFNLVINEKTKYLN
jgi:predicted nucleic-acid-binding Zn-ribbon protein